MGPQESRARDPETRRLRPPSQNHRVCRAHLRTRKPPRREFDDQSFLASQSRAAALSAIAHRWAKAAGLAAASPIVAPLAQPGKPWQRRRRRPGRPPRIPAPLPPRLPVRPRRPSELQLAQPLPRWLPLARLQQPASGTVRGLMGPHRRPAPPTRQRLSNRHSPSPPRPAARRWSPASSETTCKGAQTADYACASSFCDSASPLSPPPPVSDRATSRLRPHS